MKIGKKQIKEATEILKRYKGNTEVIRSKIVENEEWYKARHWKEFKKTSGNKEDPEPVSGWLVNVLMNKHADAMDNMPQPVFLPREEGDAQAAKELSEIVPVILERNNFEQLYSENWWYKLKNGVCAYGVFWDKTRENGLGDIAISRIDILNLFWESGIEDIQDSANVFSVELVDKEIIEKLYGKNIDYGKPIEVNKYFSDENIDTSDKVLLIDWYYKRIQSDGTYILHYCKYVGDHIIYSSENEDANTPYYNHNLYPFIFDVLFPEEGTPIGYGYIDLMKDTQMYIDRMQQTILKNTIEGSRRRFFVSQSANVNEGDFSDTTKEIVKVAGSVDDTKIKEITVRPLDSIYVNVLNNKIEEMKETSGNRDFQQGGVANGVTAASAIAALQEAGSKLSRDMIRNSYVANNKMSYLIVENIRQFYNAPRKFRITNDKGQEEFITYTNDAISTRRDVEFGQETAKLPIFDIKIKSEKANPFSQASMNEEAKTLFQMGFFNPQLADQAVTALQMMEFEGKDRIIKIVSQNGTLLQQVQQMAEQMQQMAQVIQQLQGTDLSGGVEGMRSAITNQPYPNNNSDDYEKVNTRTQARKFAKQDRLDAMRAQAYDAAALK